MKSLLLSICLMSLNIYNVFSQNTEDYKVYALRYADGGQVPLSYLVADVPDSAKVHLYFLIWLIKANDKNILVDTGFRQDVEEAKSWKVMEYVRPDSLISRVGLKPEDITDIIITHPHWDHADCIPLFPKAHIWMQKGDYQYYTGDAWQEKGKHGGINPRDVRTFLDLNLSGRLTLVDGDDHEIIPGVTVYTGSRHTYNSQYAVVQNGADRIVIASDNLYTYTNLSDEKPAPRGATFDPDGYVKQIQRMKSMASDSKYIIPGHDAKLFDKFPVVAEGVIQIK